jgi:hypothetical protein
MRVLSFLLIVCSLSFGQFLLAEKTISGCDYYAYMDDVGNISIQDEKIPPRGRDFFILYAPPKNAPWCSNCDATPQIIVNNVPGSGIVVGPDIDPPYVSIETGNGLCVPIGLFSTCLILSQCSFIIHAEIVNTRSESLLVQVTTTTAYPGEAEFLKTIGPNSIGQVDYNASVKCNQGELQSDSAKNFVITTESLGIVLQIKLLCKKCSINY